MESSDDEDETIEPYNIHVSLDPNEQMRRYCRHRAKQMIGILKVSGTHKREIAIDTTTSRDIITERKELGTWSAEGRVGATR